MSTICTLLRQYSERYLELQSQTYNELLQGVKKALLKAIEPNQIISLADLLCRLVKRQLASLTSEDEKSELLIGTVKALTIPLKQCLQAHHIEKQCAFEVIHRLLNVSDKQTALVIETKFGGKLLCKTNEPEKLQLIKLGLLAQLQQSTGSQRLLDELMF